MSYSIKYKLKSSQIENYWQLEKLDSVNMALLQLQKWIASFNWVIIHSFDSLDYLKVEKRNYDLYENWIHFHFIECDNWVIEKLDLDNTFGIDFSPNEKDITNDLFLELWITWVNNNQSNLLWYISKTGIVVKWVDIPIRESTKTKEFIDLIYRTHVNYSKNILSYDDLFETFKNLKYKEIKGNDLEYSIIRSGIKDKLKKIITTCWFELIKLHTNKIVIWEE